MHKAKSLHPKVAVASVAIACISISLAECANAEEFQLKTCMVSVQRDLGVSPDAAYAECSKRSVGACITSMVGQKFVAMSVGRKREFYIVDAGNDYTRWMEGLGWRAKGCEPHGEGPRRDSYYENIWGTQKRTLFRQGACASEPVRLDQLNSIQEAEALCKHGLIDQVRLEKTID